MTWEPLQTGGEPVRRTGTIHSERNAEQGSAQKLQGVNLQDGRKGAARKMLADAADTEAIDRGERFPLE